MTNFNDELSAYINDKFIDPQALRIARREELAAVWAKAKSDIELEYTMSLARSKKV